jgi:hypothetical protein
MKRQQKMLEPEVTITVLAYELNAVALTFASEANKLVNCADATIITNPKGGIEMATRINGLINQLHEAALALRYARHNGQIPPRWAQPN